MRPSEWTILGIFIKAPIIGVIVGILLYLAAFLFAQLASAKLPPGTPPGPYAEWFRSQALLNSASPAGMTSCCEESDGHHLALSDWKWYDGNSPWWNGREEVSGQPNGITDPKDPAYVWALFHHFGHWWPIRTRNMSVFDTRTGKPTVNPTGDTVIWYMEYPEAGHPDRGSLNIFCFVPGPET